MFHIEDSNNLILTTQILKLTFDDDHRSEQATHTNLNNQRGPILRSMTYAKAG